MSGSRSRPCVVLAALLLLLVHVVLPGLHRFEHLHEEHGQPALPCGDCECGAAHGDRDADPRQPKHRHGHEHGADCALCTVLLTRGELLPCGGKVVLVRGDVRPRVVEHGAILPIAARRPLPPPVRGPPAA